MHAHGGVRRKLLRAAAGVVGIALVLLIVTVLTLRGSLARLDGTQTLQGLNETVIVERDALGRPTVTAADWQDLARALGYLHAQERFFQMDMARRSAAGELSAMLGPAPLELDKARRMHRLRALARQKIAGLSPEASRPIRAYAEGVNAGLEALSSRPFEYWLLRVRPESWQPEDLLLVVYAMFFELTDETAERDAMLTAMSEVYPPEFFRFLTQQGTDWDAPMFGERASPLPVPPPSVYSLPRVTEDVALGAATVAKPRSEEGGPRMYGSNNWALHGSRTASGVAMLANDMHLGLGLPNTWYYARLLIRDPGTQATTLDVTGVTLPGTFGVVVGSNGSVAWGFTNSYGDWSDRVLIEIDPDDPGRYRVADDFEDFVEYKEEIHIKGQDAVTETYRWTRWGPVLGEDHLGRLQALKWLAHEPDAINVGITRIAGAGNVAEALTLANKVGAPPQNFVAADRKGNVGWTIMGRIPRRAGYDPRLAASWADEQVGWQGWLSSDEYPRIINPPGGQIWTANARVAAGEWLRVIGDGGYPLGARAGQIRDGLSALRTATERDMLAIQLDDRALFHARWRALLLSVLDEAALKDAPERAELRALVENWTPRASIDSAGFRLVRAWRLFLREEVFNALTAEVREADPSLSYFHAQWEGALWTLLQEQPTHLLPAGRESWDEWMLQVVDATIDYFAERYEGGLKERRWGERNRVSVSHPLSRFVPVLAPWLNMPEVSLPGDTDMPRVQAPGFGASQRLGVSPGREAQGYFHMPGGQSGHPLSPFYGSEHSAWAEGGWVGFLPGESRYQLRLVPAEGAD